MKRIIVLTALFSVLAAALSAQVPSNWDTNPPQDSASHKYAVGISAPSSSEQEALKNAMQNAVQQFASFIATRFQGRTDITVQSQGYASDIEDAYTVHMETSSFSTNVPVTGVKEQARKIEREGRRFVARILAVMSAEDYNKAKQYVENEEAAYLTYRFFIQRGALQANQNQKPAGFDDYFSWLRNNCVIISMDDSNPAAMMEQMDQFIKKLYKNTLVFAQIINGRSARIVYNSGKYYDGILRALQNTGLFGIQRESTHLVLKPVRANVFADFRNVVSAMKDSARFVITGLEIIQTQSADTINQSMIVINQFRTIASRQFNLQAVNYTIPTQFLSGYVDEDGIIRYVQNNQNAFPARYLVILRSQTKLERGIPEFKIPPMVNASCNFTLYDIVTGETLQSDTAQTATGAFTLSNTEDRTVTDESRRALQFLFNAKTQPGLLEIMRGVLEGL